MSSIDISAVDVDASSGSSWDGSDSELEVEVTHVVQQQKEEEEEEELDLELDESHKSSKTSLFPTKPAEGLPKRPSPRPAVQKTIVNFFSDATVTVAQTQSTTSPPKKTAAEKRMEKRQQEVEEAVAYPTAPARAPHIEKTRVIRLHKDRRK